MDNKIIRFGNCRILKNHKIIIEDLWIRNGIILDPENLFYGEKKAADIIIDCGNAIVSPGFIDIQVNGGFGVDFSDNTDNIKSSLDTVAKGLILHGVTSFVPTLVTSTQDVYKKALPHIVPRKGGQHGAEILGAHCEGPFINRNKKGAHVTEEIRAFDNVEETILNVYGSLDHIKIITLAPELPNGMEAVKYLSEKGVVVSIGHSLADLNSGEMAIRNGAKLVTHLFNAMTPFHHRMPGLLGLVSCASMENNKTIYFGLICDGHHAHGSAISLAYRIHHRGLIIVTDANSLLGLENGVHKIGTKSIELKDGAAYILGTDTLAGSVTPLNKMLDIFVRSTSCTFAEALEAVTIHPAELLHISKCKGTLEYGSDADLVFLDDDFNVLSTWIGGKQVYGNFQC